MHDRIIEFLKESGVEYELFEHEHVHSSKDAARVRATKLEEAGKALILETGGGALIQCIVPGHRRLDLRKVKDLLGEKNVSLAHPDLVLKETGLKVGTIPPFANLFSPPLPLYADEDLFAREHIVFSAGTHHHSVRMRSEDWLRITHAEKADIGKDQAA